MESGEAGKEDVVPTGRNVWPERMGVQGTPEQKNAMPSQHHYSLKQQRGDNLETAKQGAAKGRDWSSYWMESRKMKCGPEGRAGPAFTHTRAKSKTRDELTGCNTGEGKPTVEVESEGQKWKQRSPNRCHNEQWRKLKRNRNYMASTATRSKRRGRKYEEQSTSQLVLGSRAL